MKQLTELSVCRKLASFCGALSRYSVGGDYSVTLSLYADETTAAPECSHVLRGSSRQNLLRLVALMGVVTSALCLLGRICACCSKK